MDNIQTQGDGSDHRLSLESSEDARIVEICYEVNGGEYSTICTTIVEEPILWVVVRRIRPNEVLRS